MKGRSREPDAPASKAPRRAVRITLAVAALLIGALGAAVIALKSADRDDPYTAADAVEDFRAPRGMTPDQRNDPGPATAVSGQHRVATSVDQPTEGQPTEGQRTEGEPMPAGSVSPHEGPGRPVDGVYLYETTGGEQLDLLGSATHQYPSETAITVVHTDCGFDIRWQPLENRWDTREFCVDPNGLRLSALESYREFYRQGRTVAVACTPDSFYVANAESWGASCSNDDATVTFSGRRGPSGTRTIGGETVPADTVEVIANVEGPDGKGTTVATVTLHRDTKLILELTSTSRLELSNGAKYKEDYHLQLLSLHPER